MPVLANQRHELFAQKLAEGRSATEAYRLAGYKPSDQNAARLSKTDKIRTRIDEILSESAERTGVTIDWIVSELKAIAGSNMADYMCSNYEGIPVLSFADLTRAQTAALSEVTVDTYMDGHGEEAREVKKVKFKLHDKKGALVDLGKFLGMFKDKVELSGPGGGPVEVTKIERVIVRVKEPK